MTSPGWTRFNRPRGYRCLRALTIFLAQVLYCSLVIELEAAGAPVKKSNAELSRALVGSWEIKPKRKPDIVTKGFASFGASGSYSRVEILDFLGYHGRAEYSGKWHVGNGKLIVNVLKSSRDNLGPYVNEDEIITVQPDLVIVRDEGGDTELRRVSFPTQLPPLLPANAWDRLIPEKPKPEYP